MADAPKTGSPAVDDPGAVRFPEDELARLESEADKAKGGKQDEPAPGGEGEPDGPKPEDEDASVEKLAAFMRKKGITDVGKLVDLAADYESKNTKLSQDLQRFQAAGSLEPGLGRVAGAPMAVRTVNDDEIDIEVPENPMDLVLDKNKLKDFSKGLIKAGRELEAKSQERQKLIDAQAAVEAKRAQNPEEFDRLRAPMYELSLRYPTANIDQLYEAAKQRESAKEKALVDRIKANLGLTEDETARLKGIVGRVRTAPVAAGSGPQVAMTKTEKDEHAKLLKAIEDSDKF